jgi:hypothetical protein
MTTLLVSLLCSTASAQTTEVDLVYTWSAVSAGFRIGVEAELTRFELDPAAGTFTNEEGWAGEYGVVNGSRFEVYFVDEQTAVNGGAALWQGKLSNGLVCPLDGRHQSRVTLPAGMAGVGEFKHADCPIERPTVQVSVDATDPAARDVTVTTAGGLLSHTPFLVVWGTPGGLTVLPECPDLEIPVSGGGVLLEGKTEWEGSSGNGPGKATVTADVPSTMVGNTYDLHLVDLVTCVASPAVTRSF